MPDIAANERWWSEHHWCTRGDGWSKRWGGRSYQWLAMLYPRLRQFLPAGTILEIGTGYGRWTSYLVHLCDRLIGVDLAQNCVQACRERFAGQSHAIFHKNDGLSLAMVPDAEVDFVFSFDSLVHCEHEVVESYVGELSSKLSPDGVAFIHHSNLAAYRDPETGKLPFPKGGWRGETTSAALFDQACRASGLLCVGQELLRWRESENHFRDCFSIVTRPGSRFARENQVVENPDYWAQAAAMERVSRLYGPDGFPSLDARDPGADTPAVLGPLG